ncbi:MAG: hypothetical protein ACFE0Q_02100 [Anaerolineae bacterium]
MTTHHIALTIDTDPDGLNAHTPDRRNLVWDGLHFAMQHFHSTSDYPLTWYVRADGQLEHAYQSLTYLFDTYVDFWRSALGRGDELGWHPHLYTAPATPNDAPQIITDPVQAVAELTRIHQGMANVPFPLSSFRMGEAWHTSATLNLIESLGFTIDSTAIPERDDSQQGHPRNWRGAPNHPYYPDRQQPRLIGDPRLLLEVPMNSWYFQTSYDNAPKLRYMNPCIHPHLWQQALDRWQAQLLPAEQYAWVLILHPGEAMPRAESDLLYAHSLKSMQHNLYMFEKTIHALGHDVVWSTLSQVRDRWLAYINN